MRLRGYHILLTKSKYVNKIFNKVQYFSESSYHAKFQDCKRKIIFVPPTSYVGMTTRLVLFVAQSENVEKRGRLQWHKVYTKFNENPSTGQNVITDRQMCKHD